MLVRPRRSTEQDIIPANVRLRAPPEMSDRGRVAGSVGDAWSFEMLASRLPAFVGFSPKRWALHGVESDERRLILIASIDSRAVDVEHSC